MGKCFAKKYRQPVGFDPTTPTSARARVSATPRMPFTGTPTKNQGVRLSNRFTIDESFLENKLL